MEITDRRRGVVLRCRRAAVASSPQPSNQVLPEFAGVVGDERQLAGLRLTGNQPRRMDRWALPSTPDAPGLPGVLLLDSSTET
jgi:hypothetical protein